MPVSAFPELLLHACTIMFYFLLLSTPDKTKAGHSYAAGRSPMAEPSFGDRHHSIVNFLFLIC